jgi:hypothetical protein
LEEMQMTLGCCFLSHHRKSSEWEVRRNSLKTPAIREHKTCLKSARRLKTFRADFLNKNFSKFAFWKNEKNEEHKTFHLSD